MEPDPGTIHTTPRWVKIFGIIALLLALLIVFIVFTGIGGPHGPSRHVPSTDAGGKTLLEGSS